jgi:NDP-sugar pyrophosphorylase family protein
MHAMILAAGLGTRLRPLTDTLPKPLVRVAGRPVIEYAIGLLRAVGIRDVVINVHHLREMLQRHLGDGSAWDMRIRYSIEEEILDTGGGIKKAAALLGDEPFVVLNGDTIMDAPLAGLIARHHAERAMATMLLRPDPAAERYGIIRTDAEGRVRSFLGTPAVPSDAPWASYMFAGLHVLDPRVFSIMPAGRPFSITRETYPLMLARGDVVLGVPFEGVWFTVDTPEALDAADQALRTGRVSLPYL